MAKYKFALNSNKQIISADDIAHKPVNDVYHCLGCSGELTAKVNDCFKQPHFSHKIKVECNGETYLHNLGKLTFYQTYVGCLESNEPFKISLTSNKVCRKFKPLLLANCELGILEKSYDLTNYYREIKIEKKDGNFIPDLMLCSTSNPDEKIYIEIAVTHFISKEKEGSGKRIIEIPLEDESEIEKISKAHLTAADAMFLGFNHSTTAITDSECACAIKKHYAFFVFSSGKAILLHSSLAAHFDYMNKNKEKIIYSNILKCQKSEEDEIFNSTENSGFLFVEQVELAYERGIKIRNCFLCRYQGVNWDFNRQAPIFCRGKKIRCTSNQAATCDWYKPNDIVKSEQIKK